MEKNDSMKTNDRRHFLASLATGAASVGIATIASTQQALAHENVFSVADSHDEDDWFKQIKGKHRVVFDATQPHDILTFAWPRVFLVTNEKTGTPAKDQSVVVVLRHSAIPFAMEDKLWEKYKFGETFKVNDGKTKAPALRNPFWNPQKGDFNVPGLGPVAIGINELQESGVLFCVCDMALTVNSSVIADKMKMDPVEIKKEWEAGLLPGIHRVPSGVWALGRAQEKGCAYIFAG